MGNHRTNLEEEARSAIATLDSDRPRLFSNASLHTYEHEHAGT